MERLLARVLASALGGLERRPDDAWLPAATLGRIARSASDGLDRMSLRTMADDAGLSVSAVSRGFRGSTGLTPGDHLVALRMERAASLLATTDLAMAEVAVRVGLSSAGHASQ